MTRLRIRNRCRNGSAPGGHSLISSPVSAIRSNSAVLPTGYGRSTPQASTATVSPPAVSAPRWAAASMPNAPPETTVQPRSASPYAELGRRRVRRTRWRPARRPPRPSGPAPRRAATAPRTHRQSGGAVSRSTGRLRRQPADPGQVAQPGRPLLVLRGDQPRTEPLGPRQRARPPPPRVGPAQPGAAAPRSAPGGCAGDSGPASRPDRAVTSACTAAVSRLRPARPAPTRASRVVVHCGVRAGPRRRVTSCRLPRPQSRWLRRTSSGSGRSRPSRSAIGPGQPQHPVEATRRQRPLSRRSRSGAVPGAGSRHGGRRRAAPGTSALIRQPRRGPSGGRGRPGLRHPLGHRRRRLRRSPSVASSSAARSGMQPDLQVDPVQQRPGEPAQVAAADQRRALADARRRPAWRTGRDWRPGPVAPGPGSRCRHRPGQRHVAILQRLAQRLQGALAELGSLVQEQHPAVRQRQARRAGPARSRRRPAPAGWRVWCGAWNGGRRINGAAGRQRPGDRVQRGDLQRRSRRPARAGSTAVARRASSCLLRAVR